MYDQSLYALFALQYIVISDKIKKKKKKKKNKPLNIKFENLHIVKVTRGGGGVIRCKWVNYSISQGEM